MSFVRRVRGLLGVGMFALAAQFVCPIGTNDSLWRPESATAQEAAKKEKRAKRIAKVPTKAHKGAATAIAIPLKDIEIDGKLDDWPTKSMVKHYILNLATDRKSFGGYDVKSLVDVDLSTSPDLSAYFMVGYETNVELEYDYVYVAIVVRDDKLVAKFDSYLTTDATEIYVDGAHAEERQIPVPGGQVLDASKMAALQLAAVPGDGPAYGSPDGNPSMFGEGVDETHARVAYSRDGALTIYEWAIQPYDHYPERPTVLLPGKRIGFEVVVVDKDSDKNGPSWVCWGPVQPMKFFAADTLGDLIIGQAD